MVNWWILWRFYSRSRYSWSLSWPNRNGSAVFISNLVLRPPWESHRDVRSPPQLDPPPSLPLQVPLDLHRIVLCAYLGLRRGPLLPHTHPSCLLQRQAISWKAALGIALCQGVLVFSAPRSLLQESKNEKVTLGIELCTKERRTQISFVEDCVCSHGTVSA